MTEHPIAEPHIKKRIYDRQNGLCAYCGGHRNINYMTIDHIRPLSKGGTDDPENLQCTCKMCNRMKDNMLPDEFVKYAWTIFKNSVKIYLLDTIRRAVIKYEV